MQPHQYPATTGRTLTSYLLAAAAATPRAPAVQDRDRRLTYAELDAASNAIATVLVARGLKLGQRVGIWLNKSLEALVAIHAVLRAGGVYVPVDPTSPPRRAAGVLGDCGVAQLITTRDRVQAMHRSAPGRLDSIPLLLVGKAESAPEAEQDHAAEAAVGWADALARGADGPAVLAATASDDLAYILYTSGSTGVPKGVMLSHGNARAFVDWAVDELCLTGEDVLSSHAPFHFDLSILDVFAAAAVGATVALVPESRVGQGPALTRFILDEGVTIWYSVPSALVRIAEAGVEGRLIGSRLRVVAFAGEPYSIRRLRTLSKVLPERVAMYNLYGPTETNVCTFHRVSAEDLAATAPDAAPPIGRACPYAVTLLVDESGARLPQEGVQTGQLCVGGASVMAGYWGDPAATTRRTAVFDGDPYYLTGDTVRRDEAGRYVFVGRDDEMVKVKGYRIELGEIEAALEGWPAVEQAVCVLVPAPDEGARITVFATLHSGSEADARTLRRHCRELLPGYMIPDRIEFVPRLPYTSTGKVDRRTLLLSARSLTGADPVGAPEPASER